MLMLWNDFHILYFFVPQHSTCHTLCYIILIGNHKLRGENNVCKVAQCTIYLIKIWHPT